MSVKAVQAGEGTKNALTENPVGGLLYSSANYQSDNQFLEMMTNTRSYSKYPLFWRYAQNVETISVLV